MKKLIFIICITFCFGSCSTPEPRKPVTSSSGSFYRESAERAKKMLAKEEAMFQQLIENDSVNSFQASKDGFWFSYIKQDSTEIYLPKEDDIVTLMYNVQDVNGNIIYSKESIDTINYLVDKQENIFLGMRRAVKLLGENEEAIIYFPSSLAYGYVGDRKRIGRNMPLKVQLEIIDIQQQTQDSIPN
ncbi:peptidyl-prolyl isomerase, gliding motility-associated [Pustulibacterium marinum]|uniref:Peptidyl-prolyl cis-trans isomerase n=1 Tax=Pustulibacterium marinum TaxID=1224947 RepID=A0A1I7G510_9FLAO|nr:gliding motility-associated peptidyl-prolyl isomerase GldI [Pustulibacterium marinum]SFU43528.1 peptidyl-prolyl isomerase, gliding motility-associated [Pustulibacterium marinum]